MTPLVSIITVNYKQPEVTTELLDSLSKLSYPNLEVIVVDNDQQYDNSFLYRTRLPYVKVINSKENLGFAGGNNLGIERAKGKYLFFVNNDTEIENGVIESLLSVFETHQDVGAVSPVLKYFDAPEKIQFAGFTEINPYTGRNDLIQTVSGPAVESTPYFHGAAVMVSKDVIDQCGQMPEEYFLYYEELEWSRQIRLRGYQLMVDKRVSVLHKESVTTGKNSPLKVYYQNRNRVHFMRKSKSTWLFFITFYLLISTPKNLLTHLVKRESSHLKSLIKAFKDGLIKPKYGFQPIG
ncbi:glycosyltransferase family 2 protein [Roseivirga pacifica]|uniref:glycosyltransferase family 2 protein n=1 Tax=Roseivirga pacifica TaxID=1267423 RepID=UPI00227D633F|nr:glycosyltransferase family 2 protein [Roseivirga pacifica]